MNNVEIIYDIANLNDIPELVRLRILYMIDDFGSITDEERAGMEKQLPGYFERELGKKLIAFVARAEGRLVAAAYLLIIEKPANPFFLNGLDSEVLSVYTEEGYRGKGICTNLMRNMIDYAAEHKISRIDLMATDEGYPIYKKLGFEDKVQKYKDMRLDGFGLLVEDMGKMIRFYRDVLGFEIKEEENTSNVYLVKDGTLFLLYGRKDFEKMTNRRYEYIKGLNGHFEIALYVDTFEEVDEAYRKAVENGATSVLEPELEPWGQRTCYIADPEGNLIEIGSWNKPYEEKDLTEG